MSETPTALTADDGTTPPATDENTGTEQPAPETPPASEQQEKTDPAQTEKPAQTDADGSKPADSELALKLPEGVGADDGILAEFKPLAKELGLKSDSAQKLVDLYLKRETTRAQESEKHWAEQQQRWVETAKKDKEFGGDAFDGNLVTARKAIQQFATPELRTLLNEVGLGNHPELIRFCYRVGKALGEDTVAGSTASSAPKERSDETVLRGLYPSMFQQQET